MTNGEKIKEIFPDLEISPDPYSPSIDIYVGGIMMMRVDRNWWNAEYKKLTTKVDCDNTDCNNCVNHKYCDYEPTTKNNLVVDAISRADVNQVIEDYMDEQYHVLSDRTRERAFGAKAVKARINELNPATSIRPKGHWICDGKGRSFADYHCSECGLKLALCGQDIKQRQDSGYSLFCGGCGADMREVIENDEN